MAASYQCPKCDHVWSIKMGPVCPNCSYNPYLQVETKDEPHIGPNAIMALMFIAFIAGICFMWLAYVIAGVC